ncbi:MAG: BrnT family toxin [Fimbriimonadaceae bacterium]
MRHLIPPVYSFEWDEAKALRNFQKHGISFDLARTVFHDPAILTVPDLEHSEAEERWFSVGRASSGVVLSVAHLWSDRMRSEAQDGVIVIRIISARRATRSEIGYYEGAL